MSVLCCVLQWVVGVCRDCCFWSGLFAGEGVCCVGYAGWSMWKVLCGWAIGLWCVCLVWVAASVFVIVGMNCDVMVAWVLWDATDICPC